MNMPTLIEGEPVVQQMKADYRSRVEALKQQGIVPCLATVLVGEDPASATYVRMKGNACRRWGLESRQILLPATITQDELLSQLQALNEDPLVHGILLQHPIPDHLDERAAFEQIDPRKDVDGVTLQGFAASAFALPAFASCTPAAIMALLDAYEIALSGKRVVVVGRSAILGRPVSMLLLNRDATVTICHSRTRELPQVLAEADLVVAALGKPNFIQGAWIKPGAVVIDAGYNPGNVGDVHFESCAAVASAITPVPGGVGPVTIATLLAHTVQAAEGVKR